MHILTLKLLLRPSVQYLDPMSESLDESPATERHSEDSNGQLLAVAPQPEPAGTSPPAGPQEDTKEAAYARMQALLAERNGLPPPQSLSTPIMSQPSPSGALHPRTHLSAHGARIAAGAADRSTSQ